MGSRFVGRMQPCQTWRRTASSCGIVCVVKMLAAIWRKRLRRDQPRFLSGKALAWTCCRPPSLLLPSPPLSSLHQRNRHQERGDKGAEKRRSMRNHPWSRIASREPRKGLAARGGVGFTGFAIEIPLLLRFAACPSTHALPLLLRSSVAPSADASFTRWDPWPPPFPRGWPEEGCSARAVPIASHSFRCRAAVPQQGGGKGNGLSV